MIAVDDGRLTHAEKISDALKARVRHAVRQIKRNVAREADHRDLAMPADHLPSRMLDDVDDLSDRDTHIPARNE